MLSGEVWKGTDVKREVAWHTCSFLALLLQTFLCLFVFLTGLGTGREQEPQSVLSALNRVAILISSFVNEYLLYKT